MDHLISLRHTLHQYPEVSNNEYLTAGRITSFIKEYDPDEIIDLGKTGKAFVFKGEEADKTLMFRAELDALPIREENSISHISRNKGIAHLCGHDGHMAILAGLAERIAGDRPEKGKAVLLFQPAEELEQGARDVINDNNFKAIRPDYIFALHNIPGVEKHSVVLKKNTIAAASKGMTVRLFGKTSHAGEPENGINPANAISRIIRELGELIAMKILFGDLAMLTVIQIQLGEASFGTSPGYGEIRFTLRAYENRDMELLTTSVEKIIQKITSDENLKHETEYSEIFPATVNSDECIEIIAKSAEELGLEIEWRDKPYRWSEDFGYFTEIFKGGFFGLGSGRNQPSLHNPDFDFPDDIIETGVNLFYKIYKSLK